MSRLVVKASSTCAHVCNIVCTYTRSILDTYWLTQQVQLLQNKTRLQTLDYLRQTAVALRNGGNLSFSDGLMVFLLGSGGVTSFDCTADPCKIAGVLEDKPLHLQVSLCLSVSISVCLYVCPFPCLSFSMSVCLYVFLSLYLSVFTSCHTVLTSHCPQSRHTSSRYIVLCQSIKPRTKSRTNTHTHTHSSLPLPGVI